MASVYCNHNIHNAPVSHHLRVHKSKLNDIIDSNEVPRETVLTHVLGCLFGVGYDEREETALLCSPESESRAT